MKISNEIKIAILVLVTLGCSVLGYMFVKNMSVLSSSNFYYTLCSNVDGISISDPVTLQGVRIGAVKAFKLERGAVKLQVQIDKNISLPEDSKILIGAADLFGHKKIKVLLGASSHTCASETLLPSEEASGFMDQLGPVRRELETAMTKLNKLLEFTNNLLDKEVELQLKQAVRNTAVVTRNVATFTHKFNASSDTLVSAIDNFNQISAGLVASLPKFQRTLDNLETVGHDIKEANIGKGIRTTNELLSKFNASMDAPGGIVNALFNDDKLYHNLVQTTADLDKLIADIRANPKSFFHFSIFGKHVEVKPQTYKVRDAE